MPIPLRYSLGPFGLDPSLADPDAAVAIAPKPESVVEDESYSKSQNNPLVFDPAQRRYIRAYDPQAEAIGFVPPATPRTQTTPMAPPARFFAPTPEQLDQQRDRWFSQVTPMAAMGNRRAQAAIEAADRAMIREKVAQGMDYARALMETRMHSGLPITMAEESLARQLSPKPPVEKVDLDGTTAWRIGNALHIPTPKNQEGLTPYQQKSVEMRQQSANQSEKKSEISRLTKELQSTDMMLAKRYLSMPDQELTPAKRAQRDAYVKARDTLAKLTATDTAEPPQTAAATNAVPTTGAPKFRVLSITPAE